ncbi:MAG: YHS domain-containing protein [Acidimicrobiaceae bacterium]|nr:YHS domain-containing protein [Acidimicrobiaceae bacterium]
MIYLSIYSKFAGGAEEAFYMFWDTAWALVLGFALSGAVQSFVTRNEMENTLGDHRPKTVAKASLFGMASSSCSYAASAMAKSLFAKGADFLSAMAFMFASTNLVIELGIVLLILLGWQFFAAEFIGGVIMISLLVAVGAAVITPAAIAKARNRVRSPEGSFDSSCATPLSVKPSTGTYDRSCPQFEDGSQTKGKNLQSRLKTPALWADAANYALSDLKMLRKEMLIGFLVAGYLATIVPGSVWSVVFITGHGTLTQIENALVGPIIAFLSFVCSIGNIPLAAALWKGGISFGGVISFIFADLVAFPLTMIYRKLYGTRLAVQMVLLFWLVMSVAGFIIEEIFRPIGIIPTNRKIQILSSGISLNWSSYLDIIFFLVFAGMIWIARNRTRFGGGQGYATDPVCGMQVETANAPAKTNLNGGWVYFCSDNCKERYAKSPELQQKAATALKSQHPSPGPVGTRTFAQTAAKDPVCGMAVDTAAAEYTSHSMGTHYYFCSSGCKERFDNSADIQRRDSQMSSHDHSSDQSRTAIDPICNMTVQIENAEHTANIKGVDYYFCCSGCKEKFMTTSEA